MRKPQSKITQVGTMARFGNFIFLSKWENAADLEPCEYSAEEFIKFLLESYKDSGTTQLVYTCALVSDLWGLIPILDGSFEFSVLGNSTTELYSVSVIDCSSRNVVIAFSDVSKIFGACQFTDVYSKWMDLCKSLDYLEPTDLGTRVFSCAGLQRIKAKRIFGKLKYQDSNGNSWSLLKSIMIRAKSERAKSFNQYRTEAFCNNGGLSIVNKYYSYSACENVIEFDIASAYHADMIAHPYPIKFRKASPTVLNRLLMVIKDYSVDDLLKDGFYRKPFPTAFNAYIKFENIRPSDLAEDLGFTSISCSNYKSPSSNGDLFLYNNTRDVLTKQALYNSSQAKNDFIPPIIQGETTSVYSKIQTAEVLYAYMNEIEFFITSLLYKWDSVSAIFGYISSTWKQPENFYVLQSMAGYTAKTEFKDKIKKLKKTNQSLREVEELEYYYRNFVKGPFNSVYGNLLMGLAKPDIVLNDDNTFGYDSCVHDQESYDHYLETHAAGTSIFNWGMRVSGWSRLHLLIAIVLVSRTGNTVIAGDTDSIHVKLLDDHNSIERVTSALNILNNCIRKAMSRPMNQIKENYPNLYNSIDNIGLFEQDSSIRTEFILNSKSRVYLYPETNTVSVCASGIVHDQNMIDTQDVIQNLVDRGFEFSFSVEIVLGYGSILDHSVNLLSIWKLNKDTGELEEEKCKAYQPLSKYTHSNISTIEYLINERKLTLNLYPRIVGIIDGKLHISQIGYETDSLYLFRGSDIEKHGRETVKPNGTEQQRAAV